MSSVIASTTYDPANGSTVAVTSVSYASTCWVRSASRAAFSVGSAIASSKELVCSDCVPPSTAAEALHGDPDQVDLGLLRGQLHAGGLRVEPQHQRLRVLRAELVAHDLRPDPPGRAELRDLLEQRRARHEEERQPRREVVDVQARRRSRRARTRCRSASVNAISCAGVAPASAMW